VKLGIAGRNLFPVLCTSAKKNIGTQQLMSFIASALPGPHEIPAFMTTKGVAVPCDPKKPATVFVYKTAYEEHLGEMNYFKVISGEIPEGLELENIDTGSKEKFTQLFSIAGKKREKVEKLIAGDIGATIKLKNTKTNNSLSVKNTDIKIEPTPFPEPKFRVAIKAKNSAEDEKLAAVLNRMHAEDPTLIFEYSKELKQMILSGQGEMHINIAKWHLDKIHKVETEFMNPKIPYRETITKQALADYKHKKQSGGAGQFGEVFLMLEPYEEGKPDPDKNIYTIRAKDEINLPWGGKLIYYNAIVGGVIDARFLPAILKGIMEKIEEGPLTGSYARDIRVTVYDGKMHPVDSNEISFKLAGRHAFQKAFKIAGPKLLEPVYRVEVVVPEERMGDVMTDLQGRRAMIEGMGGEGIYQKITARVPLAEMNKYSTTLSSLTNGRASYTMKFFDYLPVPPDVQEKLLKEYEEAHKEEE
jgi:elongation factor G